MNTNHAEVLSAFFDGEPVEAETLAVSLQEPEAIEHLVEFARLRRAVHEDAERPSEEFCEDMREALAAGERRRAVRRRVLQLSLAASLALVAGITGFTMRGALEPRFSATGGAPAQAVRPPAPQFTPQPPPQPRPEPVAVPEAAAPKPAPKSAIPSPTLRMRFDEWREGRVL